ncbi:alginate O-acetyltransferase AlgX-related protein [Deinococcus misasensis]|uniref:alginate O-acetyltransferase AlgX-related protein n=1 Tax=Deinococcus misasensis TaxID=392413 RepID=UPI0005582F11|nr:hypothetical protein [Deinococcus misasensis]
MRVVSLLFALLAGQALAQTQDNCEAVKKDFLILPSGQIIHRSRLSFVYRPLSERTLAHLSVLQQALEQQGSKLVVLPIPYLEHILNPDLVPHNNPTAYLKSYQQVIQQFQKTRILTIDLLPPAVELRKQQPFMFETLYDVHWSQAGLDLAAQVTAQTIQQQFPALSREIQQDGAKITVTGTFKNFGKSERSLQKACKDFPLKGDVFNTYTLGGDSSDLLSDQEPAVVLLGTSYSARPPGLGFDHSLSMALNAPLENHALNGSGAMGSLFEFFALHRPPSMVIWELPLYQINRQEADINSLGPDNLNQVLAYVVRQDAQPLWSMRGQSQGKRLHVDFDAQIPERPWTVFTLKLLNVEDKAFILNITYTDASTQKMEFDRWHGTNFKDYAFVVPAGKKIKSVDVDIDSDKNVDFEVSLVSSTLNLPALPN